MRHTVFITMTMIICTFLIINTTQRNSVHPIFGNYKKIDCNGNKCNPWEACE